MGGCVRMYSDDDFPIRQALPVGFGFGALEKKLCTTIYLHEHHSFYNSREVALDELRCSLSPLNNS